MRLKLSTFSDGGLEFTVPTYMLPLKADLADYVFRKLLEKLDAK